ncbi:MAG: hypothetical protein ACLP9L_12560 [Thermoguttaceae bacterium]
MTQSQLDRAVARATGESLSIIRRIGFSFVDPAEPCDALPKPRIVNWDRLDLQRPAYLPQRAKLRQQSA